MKTEARISSKTGIAEHFHVGNSTWHWACAGHRDLGELHETVNAASPKWSRTAWEDELYAKALARDIIHRIDGTVEYRGPADAERFPYPTWTLRSAGIGRAQPVASTSFAGGVRRAPIPQAVRPGLRRSVVLLRVGLDTGVKPFGGLGPIFADGTFEYVPIPETFPGEDRTYGNTLGRTGRPLSSYFPPAQRLRASQQPLHHDPEFESFTYGDPTRPKSGLRDLKQGDILAFYSGLAGWDDFALSPALYLIGYFDVNSAGLARQYSPTEIQDLFNLNAHVRNPARLAFDFEKLVLVKGGPGSRLFKHAVPISAMAPNRLGRPTFVLSDDMATKFGNFTAFNSIERSPPRWVSDDFAEAAAEYITSLS